jgi:hypothetical protein
VAFVGDIVGRPSRNSYDGVCVCTLLLASHSVPRQIGEVSVVTFATVHESDPTAFILAAVLDLNEAFQLLLAKSADVVISLQVKGGAGSLRVRPTSCSLLHRDTAPLRCLTTALYCDG